LIYIRLNTGFNLVDNYKNIFSIEGGMG
jgi:hypothetical protein